MSDSILPESTRPCPKCGELIVAGDANGLCAACLMAEVAHSTVPASAPRKAWEPPSVEEMGRLLPQYRIERMLGRGGMGAVYQGRQVALDRAVAIKILSNDLEEADASFAERFKNEARAMAKLAHPGIVAVHDFGETATGMLYIVMEFVEGTDVAKMIAGQGRLHSEHAMAITAHVCDALAYAHERGIIHRDIKPANIMVGYDGVVKVADFGLAKFSTTAGETRGLTQSGMAMGTLHFMAPEALTLGSAVDHRADIYAVGVMLFQMLTGKLPHGMFELPSMQVQGLDPRYDRIIAHAMREDREQRYQSAREMRHDLDGILTQPVQQVEMEATRPQAALPEEARPRRSPAGRSARPPQRSDAMPEPAQKKSSAGLVLLTLGLLVAIGAALFFLDGQRKAPTAAPLPSDSVPAVSTPATTALSSATKDKPFTNTLGMKFVPVPGTKVLMCIHETRRQDYAAYAAVVPGVDGGWKNSAFNGVPVADKADHPVAGMNYEDGKAFCDWLSKKEGKTYRMPTDREWSVAVGIGDEEIWTKDVTPELLNNKVKEYPWGSQWPPTDRVANLADTAWHEKFPGLSWVQGYTDGYATTAPVMSFEPNELGIYDLGGNLWEWVSDWFDGMKQDRTMRGTCFHAYGSPPYSSTRYRATPSFRRELHGFRCVVEIDTPAVSVGEAQVPSLPSASATKDAPFTNTLGMKFVPVPITGGPTDGQRVLFSIWETRVQDYEVFVKEMGRKSKTIDYQQGPTHPAVVIWDDATAFCAWLTQKEQKAAKIGGGEVYRLPLDHEWSCAVGIGGQEDPNQLPKQKHLRIRDIYPWGSTWPPPGGAGNLAGKELLEVAGKRNGVAAHTILSDYQDAFVFTSPVGSFTPNAHGLYDLSGNLWEWCGDWYDETQKARTQRGGSWIGGTAPSDGWLSCTRNASSPTLDIWMSTGFRVVLAPVVASGPSVTNSPSTALGGPSALQSSATKEAPFTNTLGMKFVPVPITGGPTDKQRVLFSIWETRVQDYEVFVKEMSRKWGKTDFEQGPTHPAVMVSWDDARAFCAWLTERERKEGRIGVGEGYRLPWDHEWSCAVGIADLENADALPGSKDRKIEGVFPWGSQWPPPVGACNLAGEEVAPLISAGRHASFLNENLSDYRDEFTETSPVGTFPANNFGLHDLAGNVTEWCEDWFDRDRQYVTSRGSSWACWNHKGAQSSYRGKWPSHQGQIIGFRCVLAPVAASKDRAVATPAAGSGAAVANPSSEKLAGPSVLPSADSPASASKDAPFTNTLGMKFVPVPGTNILMCIHETRRQDYRIYADAVPGTDATWQAPVVDGKPLVQGEDHPVVHVSWEDATAFCQWLGKKEGHTYRLPTDHEWSLAVAIGLENPHAISPAELQEWITDSYPWPTPALPRSTTKLGGEERQRLRDKHRQEHQNAWVEGSKHGNYGDSRDGHEGTAPVMSFLPNHLGIHDLGGNVWEWCTAPVNASGNSHPLRGSGFRNFSWGIVANSRSHIDRGTRIAPQPDGGLRDFGFRCVVELPAP